jgi:hypothetical protein
MHINGQGLTWDEWAQRCNNYMQRAAGQTLRTLETHTDPTNYWVSAYDPEEAGREMLIDAGYDPKETTNLVDETAHYRCE